MELLKPINLKKFKKRNIKKSAFDDALFFLAVLFAIAIIILILVKVWASIKSPLQTGIESALPPASGVDVGGTFDNVSSTIAMFDKLLPFILIGLFGFVFIGAALYMNRPIMILVGIIILAVAVMLGAIYANVYHGISSSGEFSSANAQLPITEQFMKYLPYIMIIMIIGITAAVIWSRGGGVTSL